MATDEVPGANPANKDKLAAGCWAEHDDGSLIFVKSTEKDTVIYELYDLDEDPVVFFQDAMPKAAFEKQFSAPPTGSSDEDWTWHDKTDFPWDRVMKNYPRPRPIHADVEEGISAAARVAKVLRLRAAKLAPDSVEHMTEKTVPRGGRSIRDRVQKVLDAIFDDD